MCTSRSTASWSPSAPALARARGPLHRRPCGSARGSLCTWDSLESRLLCQLNRARTEKRMFLQYSYPGGSTAIKLGLFGQCFPEPRNVQETRERYAQEVPSAPPNWPSLHPTNAPRRRLMKASRYISPRRGPALLIKERSCERATQADTSSYKATTVHAQDLPTRADLTAL